MAQKSPQARAETDHELVVKDFGGVNTQASRTAIAEEEFAWLENLMPIGHGSAKAVPYQGAAVQTFGGTAITQMQYVNLSNTDYLLCFTSGGGGIGVNLFNYTYTVFAADGTFTGLISAAQWKNDRALIVASNGYWSWDGIGFVSVSGSGLPAGGSTIATFSGRVWISIGRTVVFSAPGSYTDFTTASSGGSFIVTDETLISNITQMVTANSYLYIFGDSSINVISNVTVGTGTPAPTLFSNTNIAAQVGTLYPYSVFPYNRTICFATPYGFQALYGTTTQKISDKLDGIYQFIDFTKPVSGCVVYIFNIACMCFLFTYNDPAGPRPIMAIFFNKKWFFASQGSNLTVVASGFKGGVPYAYATDGHRLWKVFSDTASNISTKAITALWGLGYPTKMKEVQKAGVEITTAAIQTNITLALDTDFASIATTVSLGNYGYWVNNGGVQGQWINNFGVQGQWVGSQFQIYQGDAEAKGRYLGYTLTSTAPGFELNGFLMQYQVSTPWAVKAT